MNSITAHGAESRPAEDRIIAAEVALKEHMPGVARLFLAGIHAPSLLACKSTVQRRFLRVLRDSRIVSLLGCALSCF